MNAVRPTGLGEPDPGGKRALFRPPVTPNDKKETDNSLDIAQKTKVETKTDKMPAKKATSDAILCDFRPPYGR